VRLSRTVVVGRRQELVQRLLYVLTYFIRCSELLETHMLDSAEDEAIVMPGSLITTSLRKGEVEESDYVLVTVHKPSGDYLTHGRTAGGGEGGGYRSDNSLQSSACTDTEGEGGPGGAAEEEQEDSSVRQTGLDTGEPIRESSSPPASEARLEAGPPVGPVPPRDQVCVLAAETKGDLKLTTPPTPPSSRPVPSEAETAPRTLGVPLEKSPPDKDPAIPAAGPMALTLTEEEEEEEEEQPATKVTFLIGDSMSPESDTESCRRNVEEVFNEFKKHLQHHQGAESTTGGASEDQTKRAPGPPALQRVSSTMPRWRPTSVDDFDECFSHEEPAEERTIEGVAPRQEAGAADRTHAGSLDPTGGPGGRGLGPGSGDACRKTLLDVERRCRCGSTDSCCGGCSAGRGVGQGAGLPPAPPGGGDQKGKAAPGGAWEMPRNESSDSALGDSESEDTEDWQEEVMVPFPG